MQKLWALLFLFISGESFAQTTSAAQFSLAYTLLNEVSVSLNFPVLEKHQANLDAGLVIPFANERYYNAEVFDLWTVPFRSLNTYGGFIRSGIQLRSRTDRNSIKAEYAYLKSGNFIIDEDRSGGKNSTYYAEFKDTYQNFALFFTFNRQFRYDTQFSFFVNAGARIKYITRQYTFDGDYVHLPPIKRNLL